jgi:hypothetical protein
MNLQNQLEQFRDDNPYDVDTQAKRLLATDDKPLILYALALGLTVAKHRQRHLDRDYIKNVGQAKEKERFRPGRVTGSVVPIKPSRKTQNATRALILSSWRINGDQPLGDATANDLSDAIKREMASANGHGKNAEFYTNLKAPLEGIERVHQHWDERTTKDEIEKVYGEFRTSEAGEAA